MHMQDMVNRLPALKASITSTFGTILKIDSTKKVSAMHATDTEIETVVISSCKC